MFIDNYIMAASNFLSILNLKFKNKKINELRDDLINKNSLDIYDYKNQKVGILSSNNNDYIINVMLDNKTISVKSYKNTKEPSKFEFKYTIMLHDKFYKLSGFFSSEKIGKTLYTNNEYKLYEDGKYNLYVYFRPNEKRYGLVEKNHGREIRLDDDNYKFMSKKYKFKINKEHNDLYYELIGNYNSTIGNSDEPYSMYGIREINLKKDEPSKIIYDLLEEYYDDYNNFISDVNNKCNIYSDNLLNNSINKCIVNDEKVKRKLFKLPNK